MGMALVELFGDKIQTKDGEQDTNEALKDKEHVMIYFSAHWCPPCRGYTPQLVEAYNNSAKKGTVAIVFVSSDGDQAAFDSYYSEMPWFALPFGCDAGKALKAKFGVQGIPTLGLLGSNGEKLENN